jgi:Rod binding domain-containing protein
MLNQKMAESLATKWGKISLQKMLLGQLSTHNKPDSIDSGK